MSPWWIDATLFLLSLLAEPAQLQTDRTTVVVNPEGSGFIDAIRFAGREVVKAPAGLAGGSVTLTLAGKGTLESLFPHRTSRLLTAALNDVQGTGDLLAVQGVYTDGQQRIPFSRQIHLEKDTLTVQETVDFNGLDPRYVVASYSLDLALVLTEDPHERMFAFGCAHRAELFRMDMNDLQRSDQLISAPRGHWPYWDLGGVLQLADSYQVWRANHADTMAYPLDEGRGAPGWADYSEPDWGLTAVVEKAAEVAPWAIRIDARQGVFSLAPYPASQMPVAGQDLGRHTFQFQLILHETSWPATYPCELELELYRKLLETLKGSGEKAQPWVLAGLVGTADIPTIIQRERIQPSVILRTLYRGDAWRMRALMQTIGKDGPRHQPLEQWEQEAKEYLDHIRRNGLP